MFHLAQAKSLPVRIIRSPRQFVACGMEKSRLFPTSLDREGIAAAC